jgi:hypothetical protein
MATDGNIHRAEKAHDLIRRYPEFARHVVHSKLTHTILLMSSSGLRVHQRPYSLRQLTVDDADRRRRVSSHCCPERNRARTRDTPYPPSGE